MVYGWYKQDARYVALPNLLPMEAAMSKFIKLQMPSDCDTG